MAGVQSTGGVAVGESKGEMLSAKAIEVEKSRQSTARPGERYITLKGSSMEELGQPDLATKHV